ncbi:MAG: sigma 54-interacting transcriptional regulator [Pirellulales bacterium]|nr:sigma 54-interacting transcriptional regulator [Pirellulales bacterium]
MLAYLVIREGSKWTDVFRLIPGETVRLGRAPTNQIVLKDDRCSRFHAEVSCTEGDWVIRDLQSRNGTAVGGDLLEGDRSLQPGEIIRIGRSQLAFVHDLSKAFGDGRPVPELSPEELATLNEQTSASVDGMSKDILSPPEPTTITHRRGHTRYLEPIEPDDSQMPGASQALTKLCRLGFELGKSPNVEAMCQLALTGVFEVSQANAGAVYVFPRDYVGEPEAEFLEIVASRGDEGTRYQPISPFLANTVLREGEALLARNIMGDSTIASRDSKGEIHATSVVCAPIRRNGNVYGLIHLFSTDEQQALDPEDLDFTLAVADSVAVALENVNRRQELAENLDQVLGENEQLRERLGVESEIVGGSPVIAKITEQIARAAPSKATVLIRGESGVGKELVARAVHFSSPRRKKSFVCINCAALSESLLESELFGHERGAFTGATDRKIGKFEASDGGTIMLDEIGEMSPQTQAKFLRVLEGHPFERVGGSEPVHVDVRVIAATNRDLEKEVEKGNFRRDLYFRLRVVEIIVPGLRKRPQDVPVLAQYFLEKYSAETGRRIRGFSADALQEMQSYRWPGNVRELKNVIERAVVLCNADVIDVDDLMLSKLATAGETTEMPAGPNTYQPLSLADLEKKHIAATLIATGWNKSQAAGILGIERSTLDRKIRRYEIRRDSQIA